MCQGLIGCASIREHRVGFDLDTPRISSGLLTQDAKDGGVETLSARLTEGDSEPLTAVASVAGREENTGKPATAPIQGNAAKPVEVEAGASVEIGRKPGVSILSTGASNGEVKATTRLIPLPRLSAVEIRELLAAIQLKLESEHGYRVVAVDTIASLPAMPEGLTPGAVLSRSTAEGLCVMRFGYRTFLSQPGQLWVGGMLVGKGAGSSGVNPDQSEVVRLVQATLVDLVERKKNLEREDIGRRLIRLSYIDVEGALKALKGFGVNTVEDISLVPKPLEFNQLPMVVAMPSPATNDVSLLGGDKIEKGPFELSLTPSVATPLPASVNTAPTTQVVVLFHQAHPEQFGAVKKLLDEMIDRPERQIFVEGMVLEINEEGIKELGIEWQFKEGSFEWIAGSMASGGAAAAETVSSGFDNLRSQDRNWVAKLKGLVVEKKAEVLSRPSVLTINNRQATIRVGTDIPIATSQQDSGTFATPGTVAFNFKYLATGISLNVMPRANEAGDKVSLLIDTIVSAQVPGSDLELRSATGTLLASAPSMATRRIQTYARIDNNTPFIIGGLVNKEFSSIRNKIPLLGDIPYLGALFRSKHTSTSKREVIVVLTPHILEPESGKVPGDLLPKDQDQFDKTGNKLFRDTYRIRSEDVFDLGFVTGNARLQQVRSEAKRAIEADYRRAYEEPYRQFVNDRFPGDSILVRRMVFEVVRRLSTEQQKPNVKWLNENVNPEKPILFEGRQGEGGLNVQFLDRLVASTAGVEHFAKFLTNNPGKALVVTFPVEGGVEAAAAPVRMPVPEVRLVPCVDHQKAWETVLWTWNQPDSKGRAQHSIVLRDMSDVVRLQRAVMVKKIVELNGGQEQMSLAKLSLGRVLLFPEPKPQQFHPIDADLARYFFEIERYYESTLQAIDRAVQQMESVRSVNPGQPKQGQRP